VAARSPLFHEQFETTKLRSRCFSRGSCLSKRHRAFRASSTNRTPSSMYNLFAAWCRSISRMSRRRDGRRCHRCLGLIEPSKVDDRTMRLNRTTRSAGVPYHIALRVGHHQLR
jgi:hypothetical protein